MKREGVFITLEGTEGTGKSTQSRRLAAWLRRQGRRVVLTREPGGTPFGNRVRRMLLRRMANRHLDPFVELCLIEASRAVLVQEVIRPALQEGAVVVVDRFQDSTWVYQGFAGGLDRKLVESAGRAAAGGLVPDLTLLLDLPVRTGLKRVRRPNRMESKPLVFHERVRAGYRVLARRYPRRIRVIRADRPAGEVQEAVREAVGRLLRGQTPTGRAPDLKGSDPRGHSRG